MDDARVRITYRGFEAWASRLGVLDLHWVSHLKILNFFFEKQNWRLAPKLTYNHATLQNGVYINLTRIATLKITYIVKNDDWHKYIINSESLCELLGPYTDYVGAVELEY